MCSNIYNANLCLLFEKADCTIFTPLPCVKCEDDDEDIDDNHNAVYRQHCRLTICIEFVELTNSETAATIPSGGGARSLRSLSSLETGSG